MTTERHTIQVTTREEMEVRASIRHNGGFILRSTIIGNVVRDGHNLGSGFQITYIAVNPK